jgi:hypothetical protein
MSQGEVHRWHAPREEAEITVPQPRNKDKRTTKIGDTGTLEVFLGMGTFQKHFGMKHALEQRATAATLSAGGALMATGASRQAYTRGALAASQSISGPPCSRDETALVHSLVPSHHVPTHQVPSHQVLRTPSPTQCATTSNTRYDESRWVPSYTRPLQCLHITACPVYHSPHLRITAYGPVLSCPVHKPRIQQGSWPSRLPTPRGWLTIRNV